MEDSVIWDVSVQIIALVGLQLIKEEICNWLFSLRIKNDFHLILLLYKGLLFQKLKA